MSRFIKLTNFIINTNNISYIQIKPSVFKIKLTVPDIDGLLFMGSGSISTSHFHLTVDEKESPNDYQKIKKWIDEI